MPYAASTSSSTPMCNVFDMLLQCYNVTKLQCVMCLICCCVFHFEVSAHLRDFTESFLVVMAL